MKVGYARVSTTGQSLESQLEALKAAGCEKVFQEKESGKSSDNRSELQSLLSYGVREGDVLYITKLDRLARSMVDLSRIGTVLKDRRVDLVVLDQGGIDTTSPTGKLLFNIMGAFAEFERDLILARTTEGRVKAKANGVTFGRKPKLSNDKLGVAIAEFKAGGKSAAEVAKNHGISRASLYRLMGNQG